MQVAGEDAEHFFVCVRLRAVEQALIFHPADYPRQHLCILMRLRRPHHLEELTCTLQQNLLMCTDQQGQSRVEQDRKSVV